ncbi:MAG: TolC family protein [Desulfobacterales bacterium]|nr:TolC family protein [Desulfobacterales bacterium]
MAAAPLDIAVVMDGENSRRREFSRLLEEEVNALLGSKHTVRITKALGQWSVSGVEAAYARVHQDPEIDFIVAAGPIAGAVAAGKQPHLKPVIAVGLIDPEVQGLPPVTAGSSGVENLTYVLGKQSIVGELRQFQSLVPFRRLGFVFQKEWLKTVSPDGKREIDAFLQEFNITKIDIPVEGDIQAVWPYLDQVDALYISYLGRLDGVEKARLVQGLNRERIPTFGDGIGDARKGMLAAMAPEDILDRLVRRISLHIEAALDGKKLAQLPVYMDIENQLTLNMETAARIGVTPKFSILARADLIHENYLHTDRIIDLKETLDLALSSNLDLALSRLSLETAQADLAASKAAYRPTLTAQLNGVVVDQDRAEKSNGSQAETTTTGSLVANQLIHEPQAFHALGSRKEALGAAEFTLDDARLDTLLTAIEAYFQVLKAKTTRKIRHDNLNLIQENLDIAQRREKAGYSGRSDVLRWKSDRASGRSDLLSARQAVILAKAELNRVLNRPQGEVFRIKDVSLESRIFAAYSRDGVEAYIEDQKSLDRFTRFFVDQCIENSVALKSLEKQGQALARTLRGLKQKRFVPQVTLRGTASAVLSREGAGSNVPGVNPVDDPWDLGLYLELPFYSGGATDVDIRKTRIQMAELDTRYRRQAMAVEKNARDALSQVMVRFFALESSRRAARYAREGLALVRESYANGKVSVVDLADAQNKSLTSDLTALDSTYDYLISLFRLERVYGYYNLMLPLDSPHRIVHRFHAWVGQNKNSEKRGQNQ